MRSYLKVVLSKLGYMFKRETEAQEVKHYNPRVPGEGPCLQISSCAPHYLQRLSASWGPPLPLSMQTEVLVETIQAKLPSFIDFQ